MNDMRFRKQKTVGWIAIWVLLLVLISQSDAFAQTFGTGVFQGILQSDSDNDESFGFISLALTHTGAFSMRFNMGVNRVGYHSYVKSGKFDQNGHYHFEGPDPNDTRFAVARVIDLQLDSITSPTRITGDMTDLTHSSTVAMERVAVATLANAAPEAGAYTFLFSSGQNGLPEGTGYGRVIINRLGRMVAGGRAPDGRIFSQTANVTVYDRWPVFAKMNGNTNGILSGWLDFKETSQSDFSGQLTWLGPEVPGPNHAFVPRFSGTVSVSGSVYIPPGRAMALSADPSPSNIHLNFNAGGLEQPIDRDVTLTAGNKFMFVPKMVGDSLALNPATGVFSGTFRHEDGRTYPFYGVLHQKQNRGGGEFVSRGGDAGSVSLVPR